MQFLAETMQTLQQEVNWSAPAAGAQVNERVRTIALETLLRYQKAGDHALGTHWDKDHPFHVPGQYETLLEPVPGPPCPPSGAKPLSPGLPLHHRNRSEVAVLVEKGQVRSDADPPAQSCNGLPIERGRRWRLCGCGQATVRQPLLSGRTRPHSLH